MNITSTSTPKRDQSTAFIQFPNATLIVALLADIVAHFLSGNAKSFASAIGYLILAIWAYEEITQGVNYFRRALGIVVLAYLVISLTSTLSR